MHRTPRPILTLLLAWTPAIVCATGPPSPQHDLQQRWTTLTHHQAAIAACQQILEHAAWRDLPADPLTPYQTAGESCFQMIEQLLGAYGRELYAPHERHAATAVAAAMERQAEPELREAALSFPNSAAAFDAWIALGQLHLQRRQPEHAARAFYQALTAPANRAEVGRSKAAFWLLRAYFDACRWDLADRWLQEGRRRFPHARLPGSGNLFTWSDLPDHWRLQMPAMDDAAPALPWPLADRPDPPRAGEALLTPLLAEPSPALRTHAFTYSDAGLMAYAGASWTAAWTRTSPSSSRPRMLLATTDRVIFATPFRVWACDPRTGQRLWSIGEEPLSAADPATDPEDFARFRRFAAHADTLVLSRDDGVLSVVSSFTGRLRWSSEVGAPAGDIVADGGRIAYPLRQGGRSRCITYPVGNPHEPAVLALPGNAPVARLWVSNDDRILVLAAGMLAAHQRDTGTVAWRYGATEPLAPDRVALAFDGIYASPDGRSLTKLRWSDGWRLWHAPADRPIPAASAEIVVQGRRVFLYQRDGAAVFDADSGTRQYTWSTPPGVEIDRWLPVVNGVVGVSSDPAQQRVTAYRLALADGAWLVSAQSIEGIVDVRAVQACDAGLILDTGNGLVRWPGAGLP